jgi:3-deoxy-D-manno-octulosonic-acid transferase
MLGFFVLIHSTSTKLTNWRIIMATFIPTSASVSTVVTAASTNLSNWDKWGALPREQKQAVWKAVRELDPSLEMVNEQTIDRVNEVWVNRVELRAQRDANKAEVAEAMTAFGKLTVEQRSTLIQFAKAHGLGKAIGNNNILAVRAAWRAAKTQG